jgi:hypothetical protein
MLVCLNAAGDALCSLIAMSDRSTLAVFLDGIEENIDFHIHAGRSSCVDKEVFRTYVRDVLICILSISARQSQICMLLQFF